ncbi:Rieske 2Fe-2S domain-containing protein [Roseiarcaceae bacterium H3SJ34-1]|uniref:Rieske 2Fe-2S domain-containing protein n=1 Tax=Terripilifer ovatus TaxID=3032367 RepID=UPI003AB970A7|nr:Rieske 2Fe-2S domain-containing protein [Roseiarcaceae bacterium H3SJ34-1]
MQTAEPIRLSTLSTDYARTGHDTLAGRYLRRFWQPVYHSADLKLGRPVPIQIMGTNYTLYRGNSGSAVLTDSRCPHRGTQLSSGWIEGDDLRCFYHGWKFAKDGACVEQPAEESKFCDRVKLQPRPVREYLGLIFAYLGEGEPPAFPLYPQFEKFEGLLEVDSYFRHCNYFQNVENALDMSHVAFTHANNSASFQSIGLGSNLKALESEWGVAYTFRRDDGELRVQQFGMPNIFYMTALPTDPEIGWQESLFWWVPIDDERHLQFSLHRVPVSGSAAETIDARRQKRRTEIDIPHQEACRQILRGEKRIEDFDERRVDIVRLQDDVAQIGQGIFADRNQEQMGRADVGVVAIRRLWRRELEALANGAGLKEWRLTDDLRPRAWGIANTLSRVGHDDNGVSAQALARIIDIRPHIEIDIQLKALHSADATYR